MRMITRDEYLKALDIVEKYHKQIKDETNRCKLLINGDFARILISDCGLTKKTKNALSSSGIDSIYQLVQWSSISLEVLAGFDKSAISEIESFLSDNGLHLGMRVRE